MEKWCEVVDIEEICWIYRGKIVDIFCKDYNELCCDVWMVFIYIYCLGVYFLL